MRFSDLMSFSHWVVKLKYIDNYTYMILNMISYKKGPNV